jgi:hypothetical protein
VEGGRGLSEVATELGLSTGCGFRRSQPSIPTQTSHLFRSKPAGHSDASQPG